ncbi:c-type cytochrome [Falsiroseomonas sp. E2-1-a20]|uniref:c-type cytochrome n=1 Tax=Falsiroseomonas sp. E2-1-a20 TaxID=3239300 RepID=UPI003F2A2CAF
MRAFALAGFCAFAAISASASEAPPGASACLGCHGREGAAIPSLRGRDAAAVAAMMRAFREGTRPATLMDRLAKGFSEAETQAIAAWIVR